jgi:hypothetical protein
VDAALQFDDQLELRAAEVCEKWSDGVLAAELETRQAAVTEQLPGTRFCLCLRFSKLTGTGNFF